MKLNATTISVIVLIIAVAGYWFFFVGSGSQAPVTVTGPSAENAVQAQFQSLVSELGSISFDTSIFKDSKFTSLKDISTQVTPVSTGRTDPFAPIPGVTATGN